jgi:hypothetical protein
MAEKWLRESLNLIWTAVLYGDVAMRRQAAAVCRSLLELLEQSAYAPAAPPAEEEYPESEPVAAPAPDLSELGAIIAAIASGNLEPLIEKYKPLIDAYKERFGGSRPVRFQFVPVPGRDF